MELKPGYKMTEVGVIPGDWRTESINQISSVGRGRVISRREINKSLNPQYPVYSSQTSNNGVMGYLDSFSFEGDYITWTTDGANAGTVFYRNGRFNCTNVCGTIKLHKDNHRFVASILGKLAPGHVSRHLGNPKLMNDVMKRVIIPLPPTQLEQEAIAEALSDADALIESLEQLIAKKRHIKQGAMQELLSCNCRLPGFNEPWIEVPLGKLGAWIGGGTPSMKDARYWTDGTIPWATSADIRIGTISSSLRKITESAIAETSATLAPKGAIVVVTRSGILRRFFPFCTLQKAVAINQDIKALIPNDLALCEFIGQAFEYKNDAILSACMKTGTTVESIEMTWLKKFMINVPSSRTEQQAIASLLSDLDSEIFTLEAELNKARQIKQGMMQELLTGRIRLI